MDDYFSEKSNDLNQEEKKNYPVLVPFGKENYNEKEIEEETKENKGENKKNAKNAKSNLKRKKKSDIINTENDNQKTTNRNLQTEGEEGNEIPKEKKVKIKIENFDNTSEEEKKLKKKINKDYKKYKINEYSDEGINSNDCGSLLPSKFVILLRAILYNLFRPIYIYLLFVSIVLWIKEYSDLDKCRYVPFLIYLVMILTSIIIECVEQCKAQNRLIFFDDSEKYQKISNGRIFNIKGSNIQRGDVIIVNNGDPVPCDMIIVDSSINSIPLYFISEALTGNFNYNVRLIKKNIIDSFIRMKKAFRVKFNEFFRDFQEQEKERIREEESKWGKSQTVYEDFLERNGIMTQQEEQRKIQNENRRLLSLLKNNQSTKSFEKLKHDQYLKFLSRNLFRGNYYLPKDMTKSTYYCELYFRDEKNTRNKIFELNQKNICYCGEKVKNAKWFMGIAICVSNDSKPLREVTEDFNTLSTYFYKRKTYLEKEINYYSYILLLILLLLSAISGIVNMALYKENFQPKSERISIFYRFFLKYLSEMHSLIPYPIFFVLEIVLLFQKLYVNSDIELINKNDSIIKDSKQIKDLGKVDLILTSQIGALTKNERYFRYCVIAEGCYEYRNDGKPSTLNSKKNYKKAMTFKDYDMIKSSSIRKGSGIIDSVAYKGYIVRSTQDPNTCYYFDRTEKLIEEFWKGFALCHDAIPVYNKNNLYSDYYFEKEHKNEMKFFSNNEDDTLLVEIAARQGFTFFMDEKNTTLFMGDGTPTRENNQFFNLTKCDCEIIMGEYGERKEKLIFPVRKLCHLKVSPTRKRESIIIKDQNLIKLFVKGPIEEIMKRIIYDETPKQLTNSMRHWIGTVQETGCRAFIMGMRVLTSDEYQTFIDCFLEALNDEIDSKIRVDKVIDSLESNLTLLGGCFIEDILPNQITYSITKLKNSGIKLWNLTGDSVPIAYNIGVRTGIINKKNEAIIAEVNQEALLDMEILKEKKDKELNEFDGKLKAYEDKDEEESVTEDIDSDDEEIKNKINKKKMQKKIENALKAFNDEFIRMQKNTPLIDYTNKFDILIDSLSFREILKSQINIKAFFDKAILANSLTFCEFNANDKRMLVKHFKNYIKDLKNITSYTILGIGYGFNDIGMLRECDIGVGLNNNINKYTTVNVDHFKDLYRLILFHGFNNLKRNVGIFELLISRHFIFGFIYFVFGWHIKYDHIYIIPTTFIYISLFALNLFGPFLKGIFDINLFYFYDKKEKIENSNMQIDKNRDENENKIVQIDEKKEEEEENEQTDEDKNKDNKDSSEIEKEKQDMIEQSRNRMFKRILDKASKYVYYQKNLSLVESGSEHVPYKKYMTLKKFIILVVKSVIICLINFYCTYGAVEAGHNLLHNFFEKNKILYFNKLKVYLWTNHTFVIFIENIIFTHYYTVYRILEIILFLILYVIVYLFNSENNIKNNLKNMYFSFILFLNFLLVVIFCSLINFGIYIIENLFDGTIVYKLRNMKQSTKHLEEMKKLVDYKDEDSIEEEDPVDEEPKGKIDETIDDDSIGEIQTITEEISAIKPEEAKPKVIIDRSKKKKKNNNNLQNSLKLDDYFNTNLIKKKELRDKEVKDTIDSINNNNIVITIKDDNKKKKQLKYVAEDK